MIRRAVGLLSLIAGILAGPFAINPAAADNAPTLSLVIGSISAPGADPLVFTGQVENVGLETLSDLQVQLRLGALPLTSRSALAATTSDPDLSPGNSVDGALTKVADTLAPGQRVNWTLTVPASRIPLRTKDFGVYPMALTVRGAVPSGERSTLAIRRTFLPWTGDQQVQPVSVALVLPVVAQPGPTQQAAFDGPLADLLAAAKGHRVTYALDGDLLLAAQTPASQTWLSTLTEQVRTSDSFALPYADPDLVASTRARLTGDLPTTRSRGAAAVRNVMGVAFGGTDDLAWPVDGTLDGATRTALGKAGYTAMLLSDQFAPVEPQLTYTANAVGPVAGAVAGQPTVGVVADSVLSALLATPSTQQGGTALAQQRFLAELAMINAEKPGGVARGIVVTAPRGWAPDSRYVNGLLTSIEDSSFAQLATVTELRASTAEKTMRRAPNFPSRLTKTLVNPDQLNLVSQARTTLGLVTSILTTPAAFVEPLQTSILRAQSASWRADPAAGQLAAKATLAKVTAIAAKVRLVGSAPITLSGRSGRIPITIANDLDQPVTVRVVVTAFPAVRLSLVQPTEVTVAPGQRQTVEVAAEAAGNGSVEVTAMLTTTKGTLYGSPVRIPIQVTGLGAVASAIVGGALALLAITLLIRIGRAVRQGRRPGSDASVREKAPPA